MEWICDNHAVTNEMIKLVEAQLNVEFPNDFRDNIKKYDGGYPMSSVVIVAGREEAINNLVSFVKGHTSYILDIINDIEGFRDTGLIPIAEDPFGNLFCYSFKKETPEVVFWNHEDTNSYEYVCKNFAELISLLRD